MDMWSTGHVLAQWCGSKRGPTGRAILLDYGEEKCADLVRQRPFLAAFFIYP